MDVLGLGVSAPEVTVQYLPAIWHAKIGHNGLLMECCTTPIPLRWVIWSTIHSTSIMVRLCGGPAVFGWVLHVQFHLFLLHLSQMLLLWWLIVHRSELTEWCTDLR